MTRVRIALLLVATAAGIRIRNDDSADAPRGTLGVWNGTLAGFVEAGVHEIEFEMADQVNVDKVLYVFLTMVLGCGCDRCFMGQVGCGVLKFVTCGGCGVWALIDYILAMYLAVTKRESVNALGYSATFDPKTIDGAFYVSLIILVLHCIVRPMAQQRVVQPVVVQVEQHESLAKFHEDAAKEGRRFSVPLQHQALAFVPSPLVRTLRTIGAVSEQVTTPELIACFDRLDTNNDGVLDRAEVQTGLLALGASPEEVDAVLRSADNDGSGRISKIEFLQEFSKKNVS